jgi:photosystem II stability/assembly factor-like uncharacterized protein
MHPARASRGAFQPDTHTFCRHRPNPLALAWRISQRFADPLPDAHPNAIVEVSAAPDGVVWAFVAGVALFRSGDRGDTWEQRPLPPYQGGGGPPEIAFVDAQDGWYSTGAVPETQCNGAGEQVWRTADGGAGWQVVASVSLPTGGGSGIAAAQCKQGLTFIDTAHGFLDAWDDNHPPTIYRTSDGGQTWRGSTLPDPPGFTTQPGGFALQAGPVRGSGSNLFVPAYTSAGGVARQYVYRSTDGGATWAYAATPPNQGDTVAFVSATRWLQIIEPGQSMETTDAGKTWHAYPSDYAQAAPIAPQVVFGDPLVGYATVRGAILRTTDGGLHWAYIDTPGTQQSG